MPAGLFDILLVLVGPRAWPVVLHRIVAPPDRRPRRVDAADFASDERMTRMIRSLIHDDVVDNERPN